MCIFGDSGWGGGGAGYPFTYQLSSHLYQSTYKIWKQSVQDCLSYRVHKEMFADVAGVKTPKPEYLPSIFVRGIQLLNFHWNIYTVSSNESLDIHFYSRCALSNYS